MESIHQNQGTSQGPSSEHQLQPSVVCEGHPQPLHSSPEPGQFHPKNSEDRIASPLERLVTALEDFGRGVTEVEDSVRVLLEQSRSRP